MQTDRLSNPTTTAVESDPEPAGDTRIASTLDARMHGALYLFLQQIRARPVGRFIREIRKLEALPSSEYRRRLARRLEDTLEGARRWVPLYSTGRWQRALRGGARDIGAWPVLERADLSVHFDALHSRRIRLLDVKRRSSSTTGNPVRVTMHSHSAAWQWAWEYHVMERHGVPLGTPTLVFWGGQVKPLEDWIRNRRGFSTTDLSPERLDRAAEAVLSGRFPILLTYPSAAFQLARHIARRRPDMKPALPYVKVGGEPLFPFQREAIERWLGRRVVNFYGASEVGPIAAECPAGALHVCTENVHLEILQGQDPAPPGTDGDVVLTPLTNPLMPLVRYRIGDRAKLVEKHCPCGSARPVLKDVRANAGQTMQSRDGTRWHGSVLADRMLEITRCMPVDAFRQVAFEQEDADRWKVLVEAENGPHPELATELRRVVREQAGRDLEVEVAWTALIPRERSGKFRYYRVGSRAPLH